MVHKTPTPRRFSYWVIGYTGEGYRVQSILNAVEGFSYWVIGYTGEGVVCQTF